MKSLLRHLFLGFLFLLILLDKTLFASQEHKCLAIIRGSGFSKWTNRLVEGIPSKDHVLEKEALKKVAK